MVETLEYLEYGREYDNDETFYDDDNGYVCHKCWDVLYKCDENSLFRCMSCTDEEFFPYQLRFRVIKDLE